VSGWTSRREGTELASPTARRHSDAGQLCEVAASEGTCPDNRAAWEIPHDADGRITKLTVASGSWSYLYDGEGRLTSA
jgi:YD repeat-containing protein